MTAARMTAASVSAPTVPPVATTALVVTARAFIAGFILSLVLCGVNS